MWSIANYVHDTLKDLAIAVLKCGPIPRHVAFILDGNRRYAREQKVHLVDGYDLSANVLEGILTVSVLLGIKELTVYAFSIENFKRDPKEVAAVMHNVETHLEKIIARMKTDQAAGLRVKAIGNISLLPASTRNVLARAIIATKDNTKITMNFALAYTSRDEITTAIKVVSDGVRAGSLEVDDIDAELLTKCMYTNDSSDPDILIRTSGETRFSDFLLWQASTSYVNFTKTLWPDFSIWKFFAMIMRYQQFCLYEKSTDYLERPVVPKNGTKLEKFLNEVNVSRWAAVQKYATEKV